MTLGPADLHQNDRPHIPMVGEPGVSSPKKDSSSILSTVLWTLACLPIVASLLLASLTIRPRLANGEWPTSDNPDPKVFGLHYDLAVFSIPLAFVAVLVVPIGALVGFAIGHRRVAIGPTILAFVSFTLFFLFLRFDLGGIGTWFAD